MNIVQVPMNYDIIPENRNVKISHSREQTYEHRPYEMFSNDQDVDMIK